MECNYSHNYALILILVPLYRVLPSNYMYIATVHVKGSLYTIMRISPVYCMDVWGPWQYTYVQYMYMYMYVVTYMYMYIHNYTQTVYILYIHVRTCITHNIKHVHVHVHGSMWRMDYTSECCPMTQTPLGSGECASHLQHDIHNMVDTCLCIIHVHVHWNIVMWITGDCTKISC